MKFTTLKTTAPTKATKELNAGLTRRLRADDQFNTFVTEVEIAAGDEALVFNRLRDVGGFSILPNEWSVIDARGASLGSLGRGPTEWTKDRLYLKNYGADDGVFIVRFVERTT